MLQTKVDLYHPQSLERAIDGAASQIAFPGHMTDLESWREHMAYLVDRAQDCVTFWVEYGLMATSAVIKRYALTQAYEWQWLVEFGSHFVGGAT